MRVSVAMATYNGAAHLEAQLESLLRQTLKPAELVVADDASTDETREILSRFAASAPFPVHVRCNDNNVGWRENFFRALDRCSGDLIAFCDQDDVWLPEKISRCVRSFSDPSVLLVYHGAEVIDADGNRIGSLARYQRQSSPIAAPLSLGPWHNVLGLTLMFRSELRRFSHHWPRSLDRGALGEREPHDQWFVFLASTLGKVAYVDEELVRYRQHGRNAVGLSSKGGAAARLRAVAPEPVVRPLTAHRQLIKLQDAIAARVSILESIHAEHPELADRVAPALSAYAELADQVAMRNQIYSEDSLPEKIARTRAAAQRHKNGDSAWRLPSSPGPWSDLFVSTAVGMMPALGRQLTSATPIRDSVD